METILVILCTTVEKQDALRVLLISLLNERKMLRPFLFVSACTSPKFPASLGWLYHYSLNLPFLVLHCPPFSFPHGNCLVSP